MKLYSGLRDDVEVADVTKENDKEAGKKDTFDFLS